MPRVKHPKLPNGFGSIKKLSGNRSNPYAVYPPTTEYRPNGSPISPKVLCYVPDWYTGFYALMEYRKGAFDPEKFIENTIRENEKGDNAVRQIIAAYNSSLRNAYSSAYLNCSTRWANTHWRMALLTRIIPVLLKSTGKTITKKGSHLQITT